MGPRSLPHRARCRAALAQAPGWARTLGKPRAQIVRRNTARSGRGHALEGDMGNVRPRKVWRNHLLRREMRRGCREVRRWRSEMRHRRGYVWRRSRHVGSRKSSSAAMGLRHRIRHKNDRNENKCRHDTKAIRRMTGTPPA